MPEGSHSRPRAGGRVVKDALGEVQSVLVLGGGSDIALATCRKVVARARPRVSCSRRASPRRATRAAVELRAAGASKYTRLRSTPPTSRRTRRSSTRRSIASATSTSCSSRSACSATRSEAEHDAAAAARDRADQLHRRGVGVGAARRAAARAGPRHDRAAVVGRRRAGAPVELRLRLVEGRHRRLLPGPRRHRSPASGVHVMIVRPGFVHTKMTEGMKAAPLSATADAVADAIVARDRARAARSCGCRPPCVT